MRAFICIADHAANEKRMCTIPCRPVLHFRYECAEGSSIITAYFKPARAAAAAGAEEPSAAAKGPAAAAAAEGPAAPPKCIAVTAHLLVASDGYFSRVRRQCLADGPPEVRHTFVQTLIETD
jgi:hypothetical protein